MTVKLLFNTPLWICASSIRTCWNSQDKSDTATTEYQCQPVDSTDNTDYKYITEYECGPKDLALIERIGNKNKHASTLEHLTYNFHISGISRACLQELARHRLASLSVKSTRYTLKELKLEGTFTKGLSISDWIYSTSSQMDKVYNDKHFKKAEKYIVFTHNPYVDASGVQALENLRLLLVGRHSHQHGSISNDLAKYALPESYKTELAWSINARSLQNFLQLRSSKMALWEIRELANHIYNVIPEDHKYLFTDFIAKEP